MKISELLTESGSKLLSFDQTRNLLKTDYSEAYQRAVKGHRIYRGFGSMEIKYHLLQPMRGRESINNNNFYTLILNNAERFSNLPNRSVITSTNNKTASVFSVSDRSLALILPKNGTTLAMCPTNDIWNTVPKKVSGTKLGYYEFSKIIERWIHWMGIGFHKIKTFEDLMSIQKVFEKIKQEDPDKHIIISGYLQTHLESFKVDKEFLEEVIDTGPVKLFNLLQPQDFKTFKISEFETSDNNEVWFDNEFIAITVQFLDTIFNESPAS